MRGTEKSSDSIYTSATLVNAPKTGDNRPPPPPPGPSKRWITSLKVESHVAWSANFRPVIPPPPPRVVQGMLGMQRYPSLENKRTTEGNGGQRCTQCNIKRQANTHLHQLATSGHGHHWQGREVATACLARLMVLMLSNAYRGAAPIPPPDHPLPTMSITNRC